MSIYTGMIVIFLNKVCICYQLLMSCLIDTFSNGMHITGHKIFIYIISLCSSVSTFTIQEDMSGTPSK